MTNKLYDNKKEFIRDFIKECRCIKKDPMLSPRPPIENKFVISSHVCGELWRFVVYCDNDDIYTSATVFKGKTSTWYPDTKWGEPYKRWDLELREFLEREVNKQ
jgi:hypothetical protein